MKLPLLALLALPMLAQNLPWKDGYPRPGDGCYKGVVYRVDGRDGYPSVICNGALYVRADSPEGKALAGLQQTQLDETRWAILVRQFEDQQRKNKQLEADIAALITKLAEAASEIKKLRAAVEVKK